MLTNGLCNMLLCVVFHLRLGLQALGAKDLAQGLLNNVSLHTLNLAWNGLENAGCTAIAQALHQNMGLQVIMCSCFCVQLCMIACSFTTTPGCSLTPGSQHCVLVAAFKADPHRTTSANLHRNENLDAESKLVISW